MNADRPRCQLYLITPAQFALESFAAELAAALEAGPVAAVQLRMKAAPGPPLGDGAILAAGERLMPLVQSFGAAFIVNDRPDLARMLDADGVHIGRDDAPYAKARATLGADKIVGVTCHDSRHLAMEAAEAGADYVAFGAFHRSQTKDPPAMASPDLLEWWQALMEVPCVAIGGVTPANGAPLVRAGADFLAVSAGVWAWPDGPAAAVRALNAAIDRVTEEG